jgi:hypothetical protein
MVGSAVGFQRGSGEFHEHLQDDFHRVSLSGGFFGVSDVPGRSLATRRNPALSIALLAADIFDDAATIALFSDCLLDATQLFFDPT